MLDRFIRNHSVEVRVFKFNSASPYEVTASASLELMIANDIE